MAEINFVGNPFRNLAQAQKGEAASEGSAAPQNPGGEAAGIPFSPILAQFIAAQAALLNGVQPKNPDPAELPQLAVSKAGNPEKSGEPVAEAVVSKKLGNVVQLNLKPTVLALAAPPGSNTEGLASEQLAGTEGQNEAIGILPDLTALVRAALGKKPGLSRSEDSAATTDDASKAAVNDSTPELVKQLDVWVSKGPALTNAKEVSLPQNDPKPLSRGKCDPSKTNSSEKPATTIRLDGQTPEVQGTPTVLTIDSGGPGTLGSLAEVAVTLQQASVQSQKAAPHQEGSSLEVEPTPTKTSLAIPDLTERAQLSAKSPLGQNLTPLMISPEAAASFTNKDTSSIVGSGQFPFPSMMRMNSSQTASKSVPDGPNLLFPRIGFIAKQKENKGNVVSVRIPTKSEPLDIGKNNSGGSASARVSGATSSLANLPADEIVVVENEVARTPTPVASTATASVRKEELAASVSANVLIGVSSVRTQSNEGKRTEEASLLSATSVRTDVGKVVPDKESHAESGEKEHGSNQLASSAKENVKSSAASQEIADPKSPSVASTPTPKEHADALKYQAGSITTKVDTRQDIQQAPIAKPLPLPSELLSGVHDQIAKEVALKVAGNISEIRVMLKPESLGSVTVHVRMEEGTMVAKIDVSQPNVRTALEANLPQLRETLVGKGIQVDRIDVMTSAFSSSRESSNQQRERTKSGLKQSEEVEAVDSYEAGRFLGYNTMDYLI